MLVMTAKVDKKKIILVLAGAAALIAVLIMLFGGGDNATATAASMSSNDGRVKFLTDLGWEVAASPVESGQVRIPDTQDSVFSRYNALQKSQGYDLSSFAGKTVMRYVYKVKNYPGATDPVYATVLVYQDQIIGGDITDTSAKGVIHGFKMPENAQQQESSTPSTIPSAA